MALWARLLLQKFPILVIGAWPVALKCKVIINQCSGPVTPSVCQTGCNFLWNLISLRHFTIVVFLSHWCYIPMATAILMHITVLYFAPTTTLLVSGICMPHFSSWGAHFQHSYCNLQSTLKYIIFRVCLCIAYLNLTFTYDLSLLGQIQQIRPLPASFHTPVGYISLALIGIYRYWGIKFLNCIWQVSSWISQVLWPSTYISPRFNWRVLASVYCLRPRHGRGIHYLAHLGLTFS